MALPEGVDEILPLTPAQSGMLFHVLEDPQSVGRYVAVLSCHIDGPLDAAHLRAAMQDSVQARDAYRAGFVWEGVKQPVQAIRSQITLPWDTADWSHMDDAQNGAALETLIRTEQTRQFNLKQAPLMAVKLIRCSDTRHILVWTIHHLISDGWSTSVVFRDIFRRYNHAPAPAAPPARFRDRIAWARSSGRGRTDNAFWTEHLAGLEEPALMDIAAVDPARTGHGHLSAPLGADVLRQVNDVARALRITANSVLSGAWMLTLRHMLGRDDVVFGQTYSGRPPDIPGIAEAAGAFINTLPLRMIVDPTEDVTAFLTRLENTQRACAAHEFASLKEVQALAPIPAGTALFDTLFVNEGVAQSDHEFGALKITDLRTLQSSNYTLALLITPHADLKGELYFDRARVPDDLAQAIFDRYVSFLRTMLGDLKRPVHAIALAGAPVITVPPHPDVTPVLPRFMEQATLTPDAAAVSDGTTTLSYRALLQRSCDIATTLDKAGVKEGDIVPVALPRGPDALASFLAAWMVGAAYVPLDLNYPKVRLAQILETVKPKHILTTQEVLDDLPAHDAQSVTLQSVQTGPAVQPKTGPLAYVIFTSGSQGRPKGVMIGHDALAHSIGVRETVYGETPEAYLLLSSLAFDSSVPGLFWPIVTGGQVIIPPYRSEQDPAQLGRLIAQHKVTHTLCLPSLAEVLLQEIPAQDLQSLKTIIPAGEALSSRLCADFRKKLPQTRLMNEYGPTEATVWATAFDATDHRSGTPPIGRALPGTWVGVCDPDGASVPVGVAGEIRVAGPTLAQGYLANPAQTATAFPTLEGTGLRTYRTGDLGHVDADGLITFLGRADGQVKVLGHRVELAEIEAVAQPCLGQRPCVAMVVGGAVELCIQGQQDAATQEALVNAMEHALPAPFRPKRIHWHATFPTLPNGKIDVRALSDSLRIAPEPTATGDQPLSEVEQQIADIFCKVLGREDVPPDVSFFDMGGDSMMTITAYGMARNQGLPFAPTDIFAHPTVRGLAQCAMRQSTRDVDAVRDQNVFFTNLDGGKETFFVIHGTMQLFNRLARGLGENHPVGILFSHYLYGQKIKLDIHVTDIASDAVQVLRQQRPSGPYVLCAYSAGVPVALEMARILGDEVVKIFLIDPPFNVIGGPELTATTADMRRDERRVRRTLGLRIARHLLRIVVLTLLAPFFPKAEWRRRLLVRSAYVFALSRYRVSRHDGPVQVYVTPGNPSLDKNTVMDRYLTRKDVEQIDMKHGDIIASPEGVMAVSQRIISWLRPDRAARK